MNRFRPYILIFAIVLSGLLAYGFFTLPGAKDADYAGFSSARAVKDIEVISKEHHSVANPEARAEVRSYLSSRLEQMGAKVSQYQYDSCSGRGYVFDAVDVLGEFPPVGDSAAVESATYMMMVAHYDSRYHQVFCGDTVLSYGAADDGYGVAVALEAAAQAMKQRENWNQGLKILFTDAEEVGMDGMANIWEKNREVFDNVGFIVNIEARGPWGPALLFETCPGNVGVLDLYKAAKYPYTYSLTTVVYSFMPNFTDFTIVKDHIPGMNFSTITDVNHYHTNLDNFSNVSERSLQHYGEQIVPVTVKYLTDARYADRDALRSSENDTFFTVPGIGNLRFSKTVYLVINIVIAVLFLLLFLLEMFRGRFSFLKALGVSGFVLGSAIVVLLLGELVAWASAAAAGVPFKLFGIVQGVMADNAIMIATTVLMAVIAAAVYFMRRKSAIRATISTSFRDSAALSAAKKHACNVLYGVLLLLAVLSIVLVAVLGENLMFFIPLAATTLAMILWRLTTAKFWLPLALVFILLHAFSFLYALAMALTIGAFGAVLMLAFLDVLVIIPICDLYLTAAKAKR